MSLLTLESVSFWVALIGYSVATAVLVAGFVFKRRPERFLLGLISISTFLHTLAIGTRWVRLDHVPVIGPFEALSANVWGLMVAVTIGYWRLPKLRAFAVLVMPIVMMIMAWMLLKSKADTYPPATYDTIWLFVHIGFIKVFFGCAFIALGISGVVLLRGAGLGVKRFSELPDDKTLDERAYRFMALALIFDTLGVVAGAIWAQDAWGRYWSWDPLETWSLITWLTIGMTLHARASFRTSPLINGLMTLGVFVIAFFTFFGIPFVSTAMHKGQI